MNIIALETSSTICGIALFMDDEVINKYEINKPKSHGEKLPIIINDLLNEHKVNIADLDGIAISAGPGSYTGLRIGTSFAKGLAASNKLPIIPVPTLLSMNYNIDREGDYCIMLHSHKENVYLQNYCSGTAMSEVVFMDYRFNKNELVYGFNLDSLNINFVITPPCVESVGMLAIEIFMDWKEEKINEVTPDYITSI